MKIKPSKKISTNGTKQSIYAAVLTIMADGRWRTVGDVLDRVDCGKKTMDRALADMVKSGSLVLEKDSNSKMSMFCLPVLAQMKLAAKIENAKAEIQKNQAPKPNYDAPIYSALATGPATVGDIAQITKIDKRAVASRLQKLRKSGRIKVLNEQDPFIYATPEAVL